jgi:hypothetical protein
MEDDDAAADFLDDVQAMRTEEDGAPLCGKRL